MRRKKISLDSIHSNVPKKLIVAFMEAGGVERNLSKKLGVNILYISQLFRDGTEPTDKTEEGRRVRAKLFLPRKRVKHKTGEPKYARPPWLYKWYRLLKAERYEVIKSYMENKR